MGLPDEELLPIKDVADRWKKSEKYVLSKLRRRQFQRVIIEIIDAGGQWTAYYYFDQSVWPYGKSELKKESPGEIHYLMQKNNYKTEKWLEDAATIYLPLKEVEVFESEHNFHLASDATQDFSKMDFSKMSENLRVAIAADTYLYSQNRMQRNRGDREQIDNWLNQNYPHLRKHTKEAIILVVNRRKGGAPRQTSK